MAHVYAEDSDWPIDPEVPTYSRRDLQDVCDRAIEWYVVNAVTAGHDRDAVAARTTSQLHHTLTPDRRGWMHLGWVIDPWLDDRLRIFWHPATNRVRLDRLQRVEPDPPVTVPPPAPPTLIYAVTVQVRDERVTLCARLSFSTDRDRGAVALRIPVPLPEDDARRRWFLSMMGFAAVGLREVVVPSDFPDWSAEQRRQFFVNYAVELAERTAKPRKRR